MSTSIRITPNKKIPTVNTFADLPSAALNANLLYWVNTTTGTSWLPGTLGGNYYPKGLYYSNGIIWEWRKSPYQATLAEVNAGVDDDKFVTPFTLEKKNEKWVIDLMDTVTTTIYASEPISITLIEDIVNTPTITIQVNSAAYTLGDPINSGDKIDITADTASVIKLKIEK